MKPSNEIIEKFRRIYFEEYGEKISKEEAYDNFTSLMDTLRIILRPVTGKKPEDKSPDSFSSHKLIELPSPDMFTNSLGEKSQMFSHHINLPVCYIGHV
jgi:hypothetical protein